MVGDDGLSLEESKFRRLWSVGIEMSSSPLERNPETRERILAWKATWKSSARGRWLKQDEGGNRPGPVCSVRSERGPGWHQEAPAFPDGIRHSVPIWRRNQPELPGERWPSGKGPRETSLSGLLRHLLKSLLETAKKASSTTVFTVRDRWVQQHLHFNSESKLHHKSGFGAKA